MLNKQRSRIIIEMNHLDHANRLWKALKKWKDHTSMGGDAHLYFNEVDCGMVGHDVNVKSIIHHLDCEEFPRK